MSGNFGEPLVFGGVRYGAGITIGKKEVREDENGREYYCVWTDAGYLQYYKQTSGQASIQRVKNSVYGQNNPLPDILSIYNMESGTMAFNDAPFLLDENGQIKCDANGVPQQDEEAAPTIYGIATVSAERGGSKDFVLDVKDGKPQSVRDMAGCKVIADEEGVDVVKDGNWIHDCSDAYKQPKPQHGL